MDIKTISLLINIGLALVIVLGFLVGLRGAKRSAWGLFAYIITFCLIMVFTPIFSKLLLNVSFGGNSLNDIVLDNINAMLGPELAGETFVQEIIANYPLMIVNLVSYLLLMIIFNIVFGIVSNIIYKAAFKKKLQTKDKVVVANGQVKTIQEKVKVKKYRLWGGLIGAVQAFLFVMCFIMPINGVVKVFNEVADNHPTVSADVVEPQENSLSAIIKQNIPNEVLQILSNYENSPFFKIGEVGNINENLTNQITSITVEGGKKIRLLNEVKVSIDIYEDVIEITSTLGDNPEDFINNLDFNKLSVLADKVGQIDTLKVYFKSIAEMGLNMWNPAEGTLEADLKQVAVNAFNSYSSEDFDSDIKAVVRLVRTFSESGFFDIYKQIGKPIKDALTGLDTAEIYTEDKAIDDIIAILRRDNNKISKSIITNVVGSNLVQKLTFSASNYALGIFADSMSNETGRTLIINPINLANATINVDQVNSIFENIYNIYDALNVSGFLSVKEDEYADLLAKNSSINFISAFDSISNIYNTITSLEFLNENGTLNSLYEVLKYTIVDDYVNIDILKNSSQVKKEINDLGLVLESLKDTDLLMLVTYSVAYSGDGGEQGSTETEINQMYADIDIMVKTLLTTGEASKGYTESYIRTILNPILSTKLFNPALKMGFEYASESLSSLFGNTVKFNTNTLSFGDEISKANEINKLENSFENIIMFLSSLKTKDLMQEGAFTTALLDGDLEYLGKALDVVASTSLFQDFVTLENGVITQHLGVYNGLIDFLSAMVDTGDEDVESLIDLTIAKLHQNASNEYVYTQEGFTWENELTNLKNFLTYANNITLEVDVVDGEGNPTGDKEDVSLLNLIMMGETDKFAELSQTQMLDLSILVKKIKVLSPLVKYFATNPEVINTVNDALIQIVGSDSSLGQITEIPEDQQDQVVDVIGKVTDLIEIIKEDEDVLDNDGNIDFTKVDITKIDEDKLGEVVGGLLDALETNYRDNITEGTSTGVLSDVYELVEDYIDDLFAGLTTTDGDTLTDIISTNTNTETGDIDWQKAISDYIANGGQLPQLTA